MEKSILGAGNDELLEGVEIFGDVAVGFVGWLLPADVSHRFIVLFGCLDCVIIDDCLEVEACRVDVAVRA